MWFLPVQWGNIGRFQSGGTGTDLQRPVLLANASGDLREVHSAAVPLAPPNQRPHRGNLPPSPPPCRHPPTGTVVSKTRERAGEAGEVSHEEFLATRHWLSTDLLCGMQFRARRPRRKTFARRDHGWPRRPMFSGGKHRMNSPAETPWVSAAQPQLKERDCVRRGPAAAAPKRRRRTLKIRGFRCGQPAAAAAPRTQPRSGINPRATRGFCRVVVRRDASRGVREPA